jgi:Ca2+-binding RTX toxin-like protein
VLARWASSYENALAPLENLTGSGWNDRLTGSSAANVLSGLAGNDTLNGGAGADALDGGAGKDVLIGAAGADALTGGTDADTFVFNTIAESGPSAPDVITDLVHGIDVINLSAIDAATGGGINSGNQTFGFGGQNANVVAHSVTWFESNGNTLVQVDVDGNASADLTIMLTGINLNLTQQDFLL